MTLVLGALAVLALWWLGRNASRIAPALTARMVKRIGSLAATGLALLFALRGRIDLALLFGFAGIWLFEGAIGLKERLNRLIGRSGTGPSRYRSGTISLAFDADGQVRDGTVLVPPLEGRALSSLPQATLLRFLMACRSGDTDGARLLEMYLDSRHPGWRVDTQGDPDPGPRRAAYPGAMTQEQAYEILGLQRGATLEEIRTAHRTLMKRNHPDQGGTVEGAARLNAARDRLTNRHR